MALDQEKIVANVMKFYATLEKIGVPTSKLVEVLGENFIKAPASTQKNYNNAFEGGLVDHLLRVGKYSVMINNSLPDDEKVDQNSLLKICLLHQIGKCNMFKPNTSDWHVKNLGKAYEFNTEETSMRVSERSVKIILSCGIELTEDEYVGILNMDSDTESSKHHNSMVGDVVKMGSILAIKNEKKNV